MPFGSVVYLGCSAAAVLALLRAALFIHELAHLKRRALPGFETVWLLLVGFPLMVPSIMYDTHGDHHRQASFGTPNDPEYLPLAHSHPLGLVWFVVQVSLVPVLLVVRWGIIGPLAACLPQLRRWVIQPRLQPGHQPPLLSGAALKTAADSVLPPRKPQPALCVGG